MNTTISLRSGSVERSFGIQNGTIAAAKPLAAELGVTVLDVLAVAQDLAKADGAESITPVHIARVRAFVGA